MRRAGDCEICGEFKVLTVHHILPKSVKGGEKRKRDGQYYGTRRICRPCHDLVHSRFTNITLFALPWNAVAQEVRKLLKVKASMKTPSGLNTIPDASQPNL